jgi:hypothetical protein
VQKIRMPVSAKCDAGSCTVYFGTITCS